MWGIESSRKPRIATYGVNWFTYKELFIAQRNLRNLQNS